MVQIWLFFKCNEINIRNIIVTWAKYIKHHHAQPLLHSSKDIKCFYIKYDFSLENKGLYENL